MYRKITKNMLEFYQICCGKLYDIEKSNGRIELIRMYYIDKSDDFKVKQEADVGYRYELSMIEAGKINGVDENTKSQMEQALNVEKNGEYLYYHMCHTASRDGANSVQLSEDGQMKYRAYHNVLDYTGLKLNELKAKDNSFYTKDNVDLKDLMSKAIDSDPIIPMNAKAEYKQIQFDYISKIARLGWDNIVDMPLKIMYQKDGLVDFGQDIIFDGYTHLLGKNQYSVI